MNKFTLSLIAVLISTCSLVAQQDFSKVNINIIRVTDSIFMLTGAGGNIGLSIGKDGVFMIDDQFAALSPKIRDAIKTLSDQPVRFLVNTHFHGDHTGGNENFKESGTVLVAQENVRKRLIDDQKNGLPVITFSNQVTLHLNGNDILALHVDNAHTDSDALIYFPQANVLHTGDTFFNGAFPYIDLKSGGSIAGDIAAGKLGLMLINTSTKIIPGHGDLATYEDYKKYVVMLEGIVQNVQKEIDNGKTRAQISAMESLTSAYYTDAETQNAFINGPKIRETIYDSLTAKDK